MMLGKKRKMFSFGSGVDRGFNDPFIEPLLFAMPTESTAEASCFCFRVRTPDMMTVRESQLLTLFTSSNLLEESVMTKSAPSSCANTVSKSVKF
jgi:hypothetical protein